jgi:hypothetical protein
VWLRLTIRNKPACSRCGGELTRNITGKRRNELQHIISFFFFSDRLRKHRCCRRTQYIMIPRENPIFQKVEV